MALHAYSLWTLLQSSLIWQAVKLYHCFGHFLQTLLSLLLDFISPSILAEDEINLFI